MHFNIEITQLSAELEFIHPLASIFSVYIFIALGCLYIVFFFYLTIYISLRKNKTGIPQCNFYMDNRIRKKSCQLSFFYINV